MSINVGIIGCGSISKFRHGPEYSDNPNSNIVAFSDPNVERAKELTKKYGGKIYDNYVDMLKDSDIDAVSVCTSNDTHAKISIEALNAGKHVLCEKPMATSVDDAIEMINTSKKNNKILMIDHNQRLIPAHIKAKKILDSKELGEVITFKTNFKHQGPEFWSADKGAHTWFFKKNNAFFGVLGDLGIHKVDLISWLLDEEITDVISYTGTLNKKDNTGEFITVEDNSLNIFKTENNKIGSMEVSWSNYGDEDNSTIIYCEKGVMRIFDDKNYDIILEYKDGEKTYFELGGIATNDNQIKSGVIDMFVDTVVNEKDPEISGYEGLKCLNVVLECIESSKKSNWKRIKSFKHLK